MTIEIHDPTVLRWIEEEIAAGRYPTAEAMIASAVHSLKVDRSLRPEHHDEATIKLLQRNPAALDHRARDAEDVFADIRKLGDLRSAKPVGTAPVGTA